MEYAYNFEGHGVFCPSGKTEMTVEQAEAHNAALEAKELAHWATKPDKWHVYVKLEGEERPLYSTNKNGGKVTTWLGTELGTIYYVRRFRTNFSRNMVAIRFRGTNGESYYGRFGDDWSQLCRVRRFK